MVPSLSTEGSHRITSTPSSAATPFATRHPAWPPMQELRPVGADGTLLPETGPIASGSLAAPSRGAPPAEGVSSATSLYQTFPGPGSWMHSSASASSVADAAPRQVTGVVIVAALVPL